MKRFVKILFALLCSVCLLASCANNKKTGFMGYEWQMDGDEVRAVAESNGGRVIDADDPELGQLDPSHPIIVVYDHPKDFPAEKLILFMPLFEGELRYFTGHTLIVGGGSGDAEQEINKMKEYFNGLYGKEPERHDTDTNKPEYDASWPDYSYHWNEYGSTTELFVKTVSAKELAAQDTELVFNDFGMQTLARVSDVDINDLPPDTMLTAVTFFKVL